MSSFVYPTLPGLTFNNVRTPLWNTGIQSAVSGKESAIAYRQYPLYRFELQYELLRDNITASDLKALAGLYNAMQGRFDTFLFTDPAFSAVVTEPFGTGDGVTTAFQLICKWQNTGGPGIAELVQNVNGAPQIFKNGVLQTTPTNYTLGPTGIISFVTAPANALPLTWTGSFYYRCRFDTDELPFTQFMNQWWQTKTVPLQTKKL